MVSAYIEQPELWAPVPGYEASYEVSSVGRVRSLARLVERSGGRAFPVPERDRKPFKRENGYSCVLLHKEGKQKAFMVHSLVLIAFGGPRPEGMVCRHINGIPDDNRLANLAWGTQTENGEDMRRHGRTPAGEKNRHAKLTRSAVDAIRASKETNTSLARQFGVGAHTISLARRGVTWA